MISYNTHQAERLLARAARRRGVDVEREYARELLEEAAYLLDTYTPFTLHRLVDERDVARVALMIAAGEHRNVVRAAIDELVDSLTPSKN